MNLFPLLVPAGSDTHVQFNDAGLFGADSAFTFAKATGTLTTNVLNITTVAASIVDTDKFLVDDSNEVKFRTGAEVLSDIGASPSGHLHDGDTLQHDAVNSDGGAFSFATTGLVTFNQSIAAANYAAANLLTVAATNAGELDFTAGGKKLDVEDDAVVSQDYSSDADVTFNDLTLSTPSNIYSLSHDSFAGYVGDEHVAHSGVTLTAGKGLSGGGDISASRTFALDLAEMTGNVAWNDGSTNATMTWTYALSGANDPVWTIGSNSMDLTTGALKQGGTQVLLVGDAATAHNLLDGSVHGDSVADAVTRGSIVYGNSTPKWDELGLGAADTFLGSDGTDLSYRTAAQVMASLSGEAGVGFSFNTQALTSVGAIGCGAVSGTSTGLFEGASVSVGKASTTTGTLVLYDSNSANTITLTTPDVSAGSLTFTLPPTDGDNTNVLQTDGAGVLSWAAVGGAAANPAGADTQVQYNDGGVFGADATFNFNDTTKVLDVDGLTITGTTAIGLDMSGGTFATAVQNWPADPVIQAAGSRVIKMDDTNSNMFLGTDAFLNDDGGNNVGIGFEAGKNNDTTGAGVEGTLNIYIGNAAGKGNTPAINNTGYQNVGIGDQSLEKNTSGSRNMAIGANSMLLNTEGIRNVAVGVGSLRKNTTGDDNVAIGYNAMSGNITGNNNIAIGFGALDSLTVGIWNTAIGTSSLDRCTGSRNVAIGLFSGLLATSANDNIFVGTHAGRRQTTNDNLLIIDNQDRGSAAAEITDTLMYGVFSATPASQSLRLNVGIFYLGNPTHSDADGAGAIIQSFIREDGAGTPSTSATITASHDGAGANDTKGKIVLSVDTGAGLAQALEVDSFLDVTAAKTKMTAIGGFAIKLTNNTGGNSVEGQLVEADDTDENSYKTADANALDVIGVVYNAGVADASEVWIVIAGIAEVLLDAGGCVHHDRLISSNTAGSADVDNGPAVATHFQEIGHAIETVVGAGLAKAVIHLL